MASIDSLFKGTNAAEKRKLENPSEADPTQAYKSMKLSSDGDVKKSAYVEDEYDEDEAGPSLPPGYDADDGDDDGDDDEGRFFDNGMDEDAKDAMDYLDAHDGEEAITEETYDTAWLRKMALRFEKKVNTNASLRAKYPDDPIKFMESECDLDEGIKDFSILSEHSELYGEFAKSPAASRLVELLAHDNTDIAIDAIEIISELIDEDVDAQQEQWDTLVTAFLDADLLSLLISNFARFDETNAEDAIGVYRSLSVIEYLLSQPTNLDTVGKESKLLAWLLERIQKSEEPTTQNKQYASEILSILTQSFRPNRVRLIEADAIDTILVQLSKYRLNDPDKDSEEEEYMENLFDCLSTLLDEPEGKLKFMEAEGIQLMVVFLKTGKTSKSRAFKLLDHACGYAETATPLEGIDPFPRTFCFGISFGISVTGNAVEIFFHVREVPDCPCAQNRENNEDADRTEDSQPGYVATLVCEQVVELEGLGPIFRALMKTKKLSPETIEHILGILASLLRSLPIDSLSRIRVLAKFVREDYEKISKLVSLRRGYATRVAAFDAKLREQKRGLSKKEQDDVDMENIASRLSEGLYCLERIDVILAWLVAEDDGMKEAIVKALGERDESLADVRRTLQAQLDGVLQVKPAEREMLEVLVGFL